MKGINLIAKQGKVVINGIGVLTALVQLSTAGIGLYKAIKDVKANNLVECDEIKVSEIVEDGSKVELA